MEADPKSLAAEILRSLSERLDELDANLDAMTPGGGAARVAPLSPTAPPYRAPGPTVGRGAAPRPHFSTVRRRGRRVRLRYGPGGPVGDEWGTD